MATRRWHGGSHASRILTRQTDREAKISSELAESLGGGVADLYAANPRVCR
jgi:hypothetical protein